MRIIFNERLIPSTSNVLEIGSLINLKLSILMLYSLFLQTFERRCVQIICIRDKNCHCLPYLESLGLLF